MVTVRQHYISRLQPYKVVIDYHIIQMHGICYICAGELEERQVGFVDADTGVVIHSRWCRLEAVRQYRLRNQGVSVLEVAERFRMSVRSIARAAYAHRGGNRNGDE